MACSIKRSLSINSLLFGYYSKAIWYFPSDSSMGGDCSGDEDLVSYSPFNSTDETRRTLNRQNPGRGFREGNSWCELYV